MDEDRVVRCPNCGVTSGVFDIVAWVVQARFRVQVEPQPAAPSGRLSKRINAPQRSFISTISPINAVCTVAEGRELTAIHGTAQCCACNAIGTLEEFNIRRA